MSFQLDSNQFLSTVYTTIDPLFTVKHLNSITKVIEIQIVDGAKGFVRLVSKVKL